MRGLQTLQQWQGKQLLAFICCTTLQWVLTSLSFVHSLYCRMIYSISFFVSVRAQPSRLCFRAEGC